MSERNVTALRQVYVVETWLPNPGRWFVWSTHQARAAAWEVMRDVRKRYPDSKFRTIPYLSTKPS